MALHEVGGATAMAHPEVVDRLAILNVAIRPPLLRALRADRGRVVFAGDHQRVRHVMAERIVLSESP